LLVVSSKPNTLTDVLGEGRCDSKHELGACAAVSPYIRVDHFAGMKHEARDLRSHASQSPQCAATRMTTHPGFSVKKIQLAAVKNLILRIRAAAFGQGMQGNGFAGHT
jgi:hypothetical protein